MTALPPYPAVVPPFDCKPEVIEEFATDLLAASAQVDDLGTFVGATAPIPTWEGDDAATYHQQVKPLGARADAMSLALRSVARRSSEHATTMRELKDARADLVQRRHNLTREVTGLRLWQPTLQPGQEADFAGQCDLVTSQVRTFDADLEDLLAKIAAEEEAMVAAFARVKTLDQVERRYAGVPDPADAALARKPPSSAGPEAVRDWWNSLSEEEQYAILGASPGSIGNLDGIPAEVRDRANTVAMERDLAMLELLRDRDQLTYHERRQLENIEQTVKAIEEVEATIDPLTGLPLESQLYIYDPGAFHGDGRVAVVAGNLDTADDLAVVTPGFSNNASKIHGLTENALNLYEATRVVGDGDTTAVVAWMGYDAPNGWDAPGVAFEQMAKNGGERLADTLDGIRAIRPDDPHVTAVGHSYGSTTTGRAATDHGLPVDDIVLLGSPGPGDDAGHASDLGVGAENVWVGSNSQDIVAGLGDKGWVNKGNVELGLGRDPAEDDFGANRFRAEATDRGYSANFADHSKYFEHDSESLHNIAQVVNGNYDAVVLAEHKYDPWYDGPRDPERGREPQTTNTRGGP